MKPIIHLKTVSDINIFVQNKAKHPLVTVVDFGSLDEHVEEGTQICCDFYCIIFKTTARIKFVMAGNYTIFRKAVLSVLHLNR